MNHSSLEELFARYYDKSATAEEKNKLFQLIEEASAQQIAQLIQDQGMQMNQADQSVNDDKARDMLRVILSDNGSRSPVRKLKWVWTAAAVFLLAVSLGYFFLFRSGNDQNTFAENSSPQNSIQPGGNKAILKLADGKQIILDNAANGALTSDANVKVIKL